MLNEDSIIKLEQIMPISKEDQKKYKLHLACYNGQNQPLNVFVNSWQDWVGWNEWRGNRNDWTRKYIFSLIDFYHEKNSWLFGGIFKIIERDTKKYKIELEPNFQSYIGRLLINFERYNGMRGRAFYLEKNYNKMTVSEIFKKKYEGTYFPGFENINLTFNELENIIQIQKKDWFAALKNIKGVYLVFDKHTGKKYVGSAYGDSGIWSRWKSYIKNGHGWNDELIDVINKNGIDYARKNFQFSLLEHSPMRSDDKNIIFRENYWKEALLSRGEFGYNKN